MPYEYITKKLLIPRQLDRRVKLTDDDKKDIKRRYFECGEAIRSIARVYNGVCSRRAIQFILFPDRLEKCQKDFKKRRIDGRYKPTREKWREVIREHRHYKQSIKNHLQKP